MSNPNPFAPPKSQVVDPVDGGEVDIDGLSVSESWKKRFRSIQRAGGPSLSKLKELPREERKKAGVSFNILAFLFGPLYYLAKGMWRKGLALALVCFAALTVIELILGMAGQKALGNAVGFATGAVFAVRANIDYYKKMVLDDNGWW